VDHDVTEVGMTQAGSGCDGARSPVDRVQHPRATPGKAGHPETLKDYLLSIQAGTAEPPPAARLLGVHIIEISDGRAVFGLIPHVGHLNGNGAVHGGFIATLADFALGCAVNTIPVTSIVSTAALNITYQQPITLATGEVRATAKVLHRTPRVAAVQARITDLAGGLYAHAMATCIVTQPEREARRPPPVC
jgi:uncharacterized protein (TIGR00369 family)